jgi:hypothetical protein
MRLKEAYLRLREGDAETAEALVRTLMSNPLLVADRMGHAAVYHTPLLYILGGLSIRYFRECERFMQRTDGKLCLMSAQEYLNVLSLWPLDLH